MQRSGGFPVFFLVLVVIGAFGALVFLNARPVPELRVIVPTEAQPTQAESSWQSILREGFGGESTPLPTVPLPTGAFVPPTLPPSSIELTPFAPQVADSSLVQPNFAATPTRAVASPTPLSTTIPLTVLPVTREARQFQPPPLVPPLSRDPLGRDHFWLRRPVDSNALNNRGLFYYAYGSDGPENQWRIHAGIDMPNPIGETVRAAGSGTIVYAAENFQSTYTYGKTVFIRHDFGYDGQPVFTLYAHLAAILVFEGQTIQAGDPIGLVGNTGRVSGPHVHFEVRVGEDTYGATFNPLLWMVPYVNTGVIAGRLSDRSGDLIMDADVTVRNYGTGLVTDTTTTYIYRGTAVDVNADPIWQENFVIGDVPVGRHEVVATINGERVSQVVTVVEGTTTFVELSLAAPPNGS
ncbi:MAG: M23 family metallopeptidase [bacterium]|nr:M23 family metallopeptidase [bacterium]